MVQVCEADSVAPNRGLRRWGGGVWIGPRETQFVRHEEPVALCTHVGTPSDPADPGALLSPEQVARICGLSRRAVYRAIARGDLAAARLCNRLRVRPEDLDRWISESVEPRSVAQPDVLPRTAPPLRGSLRRMLDDVSTNGSSRR